jgi:hypothetical protein
MSFEDTYRKKVGDREYNLQKENVNLTLKIACLEKKIEVLTDKTKKLEDELNDKYKCQIM